MLASFKIFINWIRDLVQAKCVHDDKIMNLLIKYIGRLKGGKQR